MLLGGPTDSSAAVGAQNTPPRPPEGERDSLDSLLAVTLFPAAKPHRERIVDILGIINGTQKGRELLYDFRTLAGHGHYPLVDVASPGEISRQEADKPHGLFLSESTLTAGASEIGLPPEEEHAPAVVLRLTQIRNCLAQRGQEGRCNTSRIEAIDVPMDPEATAAAFRQELKAAAARWAQASAVDSDGRGRAEQRPLLHRASTVSTSPYGAVTELPGTSAGDQLVGTEGLQQKERTSGPGGARRVFRWAEQKVQAVRDFVLRRRDPARTDASAAQADRPIIKETTEPKTSRHKRTFSIRYFGQIRDAQPETSRQRAGTTHIPRKENS